MNGRPSGRSCRTRREACLVWTIDASSTASAGCCKPKRQNVFGSKTPNANCGIIPDRRQTRQSRRPLCELTGLDFRLNNLTILFRFNSSAGRQHCVPRAVLPLALLSPSRVDARRIEWLSGFGCGTRWPNCILLALNYVRLRAAACFSRRGLHPRVRRFGSRV
jgi:hypothetical protein